MSFIKDLFLPKFCLGCGFIGAYICGECVKKITIEKTYECLYCRRPSLLGLTHNNCKRTKGVDGLMYVFHYNNVLKNIIKSIKYRLVREAIPPLIDIAGFHIKKQISSYLRLGSRVVFQPIPITIGRERQRGFNQAVVILKKLSQLTPLVEVSSLLKVKDSPPQAQIKDKKQRVINVADSFSINKKELIKNHQIVLVDDIVTTGETVKEAARVMKKGGADKIFIFALAKG